MLITLSRRAAICQSIAEVYSTGGALLGAVSHIFYFVIYGVGVIYFRNSVRWQNITSKLTGCSFTFFSASLAGPGTQWHYMVTSINSLVTMASLFGIPDDFIIKDSFPILMYHKLSGNNQILATKLRILVLTIVHLKWERICLRSNLQQRLARIRGH